KLSLLPNIFIPEHPSLSSSVDTYRTHSPPMLISRICPVLISSLGLIKAANAPFLPLNLLYFLLSSNIFPPPRQVSSEFHSRNVRLETPRMSGAINPE